MVSHFICGLCNTAVSNSKLYSIRWYDDSDLGKTWKEKAVAYHSVLLGCDAVSLDNWNKSFEAVLCPLKCQVASKL
jgi:hypothetical protein